MYYKMAISAWPREHEEWLIERAFEFGATGMAERLNFTQADYESPAEDEFVDPFDLEIYFAELPADTFLDEMKERSQSADVQVLAEQEKDWLEEWKKGYEPFEICPSVHIVPLWHEVPAGAEHVILLEPGMAFGTGTHETTQLASQLVAAVMHHDQPATVLDVGTGTGILAMIAARLGATQVVAMDIETEARRVARENIEINQIAQVRVVDESLHAIVETFDLVAANIVDSVLLKIQRDLIHRVKPEGILVVSGILLENLEDFKRDFHLPAGWAWTAVRLGREWVAMQAQRASL